MRTPLHGSMPPFKLTSNVVYFHDWRYVDHGGYCWKDPNGCEGPLWTLDPVPPMRYEHYDLPLGIELQANPAQRTEPVIRAGEIGYILSAGSLIYDEGRYRLWLETPWPGDIITDRIGDHNLMRYAESDDGMEWRFPRLGLVEHEGSRDNNIVNGGPVTAETGHHGGCVFKDPSAPPAERYKALYLGSISPEKLDAFRRARPADVDPLGAQWYRALYGGVSADGLHWTPLPEPLVVQFSDTHNICNYDVKLGKYVAFVRTWYMGRRTIGRTDSEDFRRFSLPEEVFWPDATQPPYDLWYANAKTLMPGTTDYHLMFPMRWSLIDDHFEFMLAASPDGIVWNWVPGGPVCKPGPKGAWDGGVVVPGHGLVSLPGKRTGMLVEGSPVPHKHPRKPPLGALGWAWWPEDRLVALQARHEGSFALWPLIFQGRTVHLNYSTTFAGRVQVEAVGADGEVLPGRSFADCDTLSGDCLDQVVSWHAETDLAHAEGAPVTLRFRLRTAELYAVRFQ